MGTCELAKVFQATTGLRKLSFLTRQWMILKYTSIKCQGLFYKDMNTTLMREPIGHL